MSIKRDTILSISSIGTKIRADRFAPEIQRLNLSAVVNQTDEYVIVNLSETGVALSGSKSYTPGEVVDVEVKINEDKILYKGQGQVRWNESDINGKTAIGISFISSILDRGIVKALDSLSMINETIGLKNTNFKNLPADYKLFLIDYKNYLRELKNSLDVLEESIRVESSEVKDSFLLAFETTFLLKFVNEIHQYNKRLDSIASKITDKKTRKAAIEVFQKEISPYLTPSPFTHRALVKPLGHAGDYEMMNQIYRNQMEGQTFFEKLIHKAGINEASSLSVRFRRKFLKDMIKERLLNNDQIRVSSIACGPAKEIVDLISDISSEDLSRITFVLVDQEPEALLNAKREILSQCLKEEKTIRIEFIPWDIRHIIEGNLPDVLAEGNFDLIYSAGLFDYLLEGTAKLLSINLLEQTKKGGKLLIGNFHPDNPTKTISEFSVNWKLFHRTEEDMLRLIPDASVAKKNLIFDTEKIEIFIEAIK